MTKATGVAPRTAEQLATIERHRHEKALSDANPACRLHPNRPPEIDRPEDIAFNIACRKFEKANG